MTSMWRSLSVVATAALAVGMQFAATDLSASGFPKRAYAAGEVLRYEMRGLNDGKVYEAVSRHEVKEASGSFHEEVAWESLTVAGKPIELGALKDFRQRVSLDSRFETTMSNFRELPAQLLPHLSGPYFDLMTFYVDANPRLFQARLGELAAGRPVLFPYGKASSWADGRRNLLAEDCIDFRLTLQAGEPGSPLLRVEHISPSSGVCVHLPEPWMRSPVGDLPNNWVQVTKVQPQADLPAEFMVSFGLEYFDAHLYLDPASGLIRSANLYNTVERMNAPCKAVKTGSQPGGTVDGFEGCGSPVPQHTFRDISLRLIEHLPAAGPLPR